MRWLWRWIRNDPPAVYGYYDNPDGTSEPIYAGRWEMLVGRIRFLIFGVR